VRVVPSGYEPSNTNSSTWCCNAFDVSVELTRCLLLQTVKEDDSLCLSAYGKYDATWTYSQ
jgi:hypothetical protein